MKWQACEMTSLFFLRKIKKHLKIESAGIYSQNIEFNPSPAESRYALP